MFYEPPQLRLSQPDHAAEVRRSRSLRLFISALICAVLSACAHRDPVVYYTPPSGILADETLSILASRRWNNWFLPPEFGYVWSVDGLPVEKPEQHTEEPVILRPFQIHQLSLAYARGGRFASADVQLEARGVQQAIVRFAVADNDGVELWIQDVRTGEILSTRVLAHISAGAAGASTVFFIPLHH